jgi:hypothetical protein
MHESHPIPRSTGGCDARPLTPPERDIEPLFNSDRKFTDEFGNVWRMTPNGPVFVRTRRSK